ncbi:hypothetical protein [Parasitella parasitica]|uniref:Pentacotripeptide-repeat region of PRORP domain-containing protein n=1 Tax=Parasitella parasitica TaxID=35722 RepID=A0A0B7N840_9FUNG|nr:hypothetical protein [Parasitella parasitica]
MLTRHGKRSQDLDFIHKVIKDMKSKLQLTPTHFEYHALLYAFGIQRLPDKAYSLLDQMKRDDNLKPTLHTYNTLLGCYKRTNNINRAEEILAEMKAHKIKPDIVTYNTMLHLLLRTQEYNRVIEMYNSMQAEKVRPDIYTYSTLLDAAVKSGNQHFGSKIYEQISKVCRTRDVDLNMVNNMIRFKANNSLNEALDLYYDLPSIYPHIRPDKVTFNILLDTCFKSNNPARAYMIFNDMEKAKLKPDVVTYGTLIDAEAKLGNLRGSLQLFQSMCDLSIEPNDRILNSLANIASSKSASFSDVKQLLDVIKQYQHKLKLDTKAYNALMYGLAQKGQSNQAQNLYDTVFRDMSCKPDIATFTHLMLAYINDDKLDDALEIYYTLREHHKKCTQDETRSKVKILVQLDTTFYSTIIAALSRNDVHHTMISSEDPEESSPRLIAAMKIFNDMRPLQIQPTVHTYTAMLHACGQYRDRYVLDQVHKLIKVDLYLDPDIAIYNAIMDAYNRTGDGEKVLDIWQTLSMSASQQSHLAPDQTTVSIVFDSCGHNGLIQHAQSIWTFLKRTQFRLNTNNYSSYIECLCRARGRQGWDTAFDIVKQEMSIPGKPQAGKPVLDEKTVNTLISFAKKKSFEHSEIEGLEQWRKKLLA